MLSRLRSTQNFRPRLQSWAAFAPFVIPVVLFAREDYSLAFLAVSCAALNLAVTHRVTGNFRTLLRLTSSELVETGTRLSLSADALSDTGQSLLDHAMHGEETSHAIQESSAELSHHAEERSGELTSSLSCAEKAEETARQGSSEAEQLALCVNDLRETTTDVRAIAQQVQSVALQTRLLALNASIEAARAGESGRGFAVVAEEVHTLANQSALFSDQAEQALASVERRWESADEAAKSLALRYLRVVELISESSQRTRYIAESAEQERQEITAVATRAAKVYSLMGQTRARSNACCSCGDHIRVEISELRSTLVRILKAAEDHTERCPQIAARMKYLAGSAKPEDVFHYNLVVNLPLIAGLLSSPHIATTYSFPSSHDDATSPTDVLAVLIRVHDALAERVGRSAYIGKTRDAQPSDVIAASAAITELLTRREVAFHSDTEVLERRFEVWKKQSARELKPSDSLHLISYMGSAVCETSLEHA